MLSLLLAVQLPKEKAFKSIQIFGDSEMLIEALNSADKFNNFSLKNILQRIRIIMKEFVLAEYFHILQDLNNLADSLANEACLLPQCFPSINGESGYFFPIP